MFSALELFSQQFIINGFIAGLLVSVCAGMLGYFVIIRNYTFASHALAHIGIPGATGAILLGLSPLLGLAGFCIVGGLLIGLMGKKLWEREIITGSILAFATALGLYFSSLSGQASKTMQSILFGNILGVQSDSLLLFAAFTVITLAVIIYFYRRLLLSSVSPDVATSKGINNQLLDLVFILVLAISTVMAIQVVGSLLLFALLITPAATAINLTPNPVKITIISILVAALSVILGVVTAVVLNLPPSFAIVTFSTLFWGISRMCR